MEWEADGEEGAGAEWIGAARSQPGSFIEIFLNNSHVLVSCVSNAVSGSVIPLGGQAQRLDRKCSVPGVHAEVPLGAERSRSAYLGVALPSICAVLTRHPEGQSRRPEATGPTAKSVPQAAAGSVWVAWRGALGGRGDCLPHSSGCGSGRQPVWGGGTWRGSQS